MVIIIIIDDTNENAIDTNTIPYFKIHSLFFPSDEIDPSNKSLPINKKNKILIAKNNKSPNISSVLVFISINETMNTNIKKKYFINDFDSIDAMSAISIKQFIY
jgi:hypothetical protein